MLYTAEKITDTIIRVLLPGFVYSYIAIGSDRAVVIDTGFGYGPYRTFVEELLQGKPYDVVMTHGHLDHAAGASEFDTVYMHPADLGVAAKHTEKQLRMDFLKRAFPDIREEDLAEPKAEGYLPLSYGQVFDIGGEQLEIVDLGGHTPGSVGILFRQQRILLAGDACCSFTLLFGGDQSLTVRQYREHLAGTCAAYYDRIDSMLYSHPHNYGGKEVIKQMIALCDEILAGTDDHIPSDSPFATENYTAKAVDSTNRRKDGKIANLQYNASCL